MPVPTATSSDVSFSTPSQRPMLSPSVTASASPVAVTSAPLMPTRNTVSRFMPAPSATTPSCSDNVVSSLPCLGRSMPEPSAIARPEPSASQLGASNTTRHTAIAVQTAM